MVPLADFLELPEDERDGKYPFVWTVDRKQQLSRLLVDATMVQSCEDRRDFWIMLRSLAGLDEKPVSSAEMEDRIRRELMNRLSDGLLHMVEGAMPATHEAGAERKAPPTEKAEPAPQQGEYMAPWIDTENCTTCGECIKLNPAMFAYNEHDKAYIKDPDAGPYRDLVKAAERCAGQVIHPGLPRDRSEKDIEKWIKRAEKYN
jgi:pyruvate-ferredoxin/flavodoxin oxidoreductase